MKATIESTDQIVPIKARRGDGVSTEALARVWEGATENGVKFIAYITLVQVASMDDNREFERDLQEHKKPERATVRAIDARFIL